MSRQISDAILPEPFVSLALQKDSSLFVRYDLAKEFSPVGFAQTAVVVSSEIKQDIHLLNSVDSLLSVSVRKSTPENPETESRLIGNTKYTVVKIAMEVLADLTAFIYSMLKRGRPNGIK